MGDVIPAFYPSGCDTSRSNFTSFFLYSRSHPDDPQPLRPNDWKALKQSSFDPDLPTKVIIHGFLDSQQLSNWMMRMKNALLKHADYNIIITDWSCGNGLPYNKAIENSQTTASRLADLILFLKDASGANPNNFHLIGHSLGSHISGMAGQRVHSLGRITALDPAGPKFYNITRERRLDPSDADFVDVIHSDGGNSLFEGLGLHQQTGHIDFYPNGGRTQPGCHNSPFATVPRFGILRATRYHLTCDHYRAIDYYIESIEATKKRSADVNCQYVGVQCRDWYSFSRGRCADCSKPENCAPMGFFSDSYPRRNAKDKTREFYVMTSESEPYCVHQYQVVVEADVDGTSSRTSRHNLGSKTIYLEVKTGAGKVSKMKLAGSNVVSRSKKYSYLATAKFPLGEVHAATMWLDEEQSSQSPSTLGFKMKQVEIIPIQLPGETRARSLEPSKKIVLCVDEEKLLTKNRRLKLSSEC